MSNRFPLGTGNSPFAWSPTAKEQPFQGGTGNVRAGDWIQVEFSYRKTNTVATPNNTFLGHVIYTPNSDDSMPQRAPGGHLQPVMLGGSATKQRSKYRIDPGFVFQVPWDGQLLIIGSGFADPEKCIIDVIVRRGFQPEGTDRRGSEEQMAAQYMRAMTGLPVSDRTREWAPPVIGHPQMAPSTYTNIAANTKIPFSSGVVAIQITDNTLITPAPVPITITSMGDTHAVRLVSGAIEYLGALAQGGGAADSLVPTWHCPNDLDKAVMWSRIGN